MKRIIICSILALVLCVSVVVGGTFALFTSESYTNIAITSGNVEVDAKLTIADIFTPTEIGENGVTVNAANKAPVDFTPTEGAFGEGGTVAITEEGVKLNNMIPGDKVIFKIDMTNSSTVAFVQSMVVKYNDADKAFFDQLLVGIADTKDGTYTYYSDFVSAWEKGTDIYTDNKAEKYLSIEMPGHVGNAYKEKNCSLTVNVVAVQGNAAVTDGTSKVIKVVDAAGMAEAVAEVQDGDVIYLSEPVDALTINNDADVDFTLRGYGIGTLTVNAPSTTIHVYNDVELIEGKAVAMESLHIYGKVVKAVLNDGRIVVAPTAVIDTVELAPTAGAAVVYVVETIESDDAEIKGTVENIVVPEANDTYNVVKDGDNITLAPKYDNAANVINVATAAELRQFAADVNAGIPFANKTINILADIDLAGENWTPINGWNGILNKAVIDGYNHVIKNMKVEGGSSAGFISNNASSVTLKNITFDNAFIKTDDGNAKYAGVVMGKDYSAAKLENITVLNSQVRCTWQCGGLVGFAETNAPIFTGCTIKDSFVGGGNATAGAFFGLGIVNMTLTGCTAENIDLYTDGLTWNSTQKAGGETFAVGHIYGNTLTMTDCTIDAEVVSEYPAD